MANATSAKAASAKAPAAKAPSKTEVITRIATVTELSKKQVSAVFDALAGEIKSALGKKGPGMFQIPSLCKISVKSIAAKPAGERMDPFTKTMKFYEKKEARKKVVVRPLKGLKDLV